jgi:tetratricopeptide (TPR) repeat protein
MNNSMPPSPAKGKKRDCMPVRPTRGSPKKDKDKGTSKGTGAGTGPALASAKPSEIRAAAKKERESNKWEHIRKEKIRKREAEAQLRMQKIKDEIDRIYKQNENGEEAPQSQAAPSREQQEEQKRATEDLVSEIRDLEMEEELAALAGDSAVTDDDDESSIENMMMIVNEGEPKDFGKLVVDEMNESFASLTGLQSDEPKAVQAAAVAASPEPPRRKLQFTRSGKLRRAPSRRGLQRTPSNRVPEMRRRANQRDLLFDDDEVIPTKDFDSLSTHPPVTGEDALSKKQEPSVAEDHESKQLLKASSNIESSSLHATLSSTPLSIMERTPMISAKQAAKDAKKEERERKELDEQREKLEEAKQHFQKGHDRCWKFQDSASALGDYRKALFIRESLLGKYHEDTGRSYFWIGRSLAKLREFDEALVAFSRSLRIFERVLMRSHKYNKWASSAIESAFKEMEDEDTDFEDYKIGLDASIAHERAGDSLRKKGKQAEAIAEYRIAIDNIEDYHPDAADLYCKIAIIFRQLGEFDRALEEYRYASEIYESSLGADHPETVKTLNQLIEKKRLSQISLSLMDKLNLKKL